MLSISKSLFLDYGVNRKSFALNLAVPRKCITGVTSVPIIMAPKKILDQTPILLPNEKNNIHPIKTRAHGIYLREKSDILAFTNSSENSCGTSSGLTIPCSTAHLTQVKYRGPFPDINWLCG
jgi:hypothetical protein